MVQGAQKDLQNAVQQFGMESPQAQSAKATLDAISDGSVVGSFFPSVQALEAAEAREAKATVLEKRAGALATPTDIDDFVERANLESIRLTGKALTPGEQNKMALQFKRAQPGEAADVAQAKKVATEIGTTNIAQYS
jgi:hypothetical protein